MLSEHVFENKIRTIWLPIAGRIGPMEPGQTLDDSKYGVIKAKVALYKYRWSQEMDKRPVGW